MKTIFNSQDAKEILNRIQDLDGEEPSLWGKMNLSQALSHCSASIAMAMGDLKPPRVWMGLALAWLIKPAVFGNDKPLKRNTPSIKELLQRSKLDICDEKQILINQIERMLRGGPGICTNHPHCFFGALKPEEWGVLTYKHLDHHLRQFGA